MRSNLPIAAIAALCLLAASAPLPAFDAERALDDVRRQVAFGPRIHGRPGHKATLDYLERELRQAGARVERLPVQAQIPGMESMAGVNLIARLGPPATQPTWALGTHWDTRPWADHDPDPAKHQLPVPGANDGASGTAVLLELARSLRDHPPEWRVDLLFFDLEDRGQSHDGRLTVPYSIGAEQFMRQRPAYHPGATVIIDMVCDADLRIARTALVKQHARPLQDHIWATARQLGIDALVEADTHPVMDDHLPFLQRQRPAALLIHTPFPATWHTLADTPEHCDPRRLEQIGRLLQALIRQSPPGVTSP